MAAGRAQRSTPVAVAALAVLLTGCSGTPLGDRLAGSFSAAPAPQPPPATPALPPAAGANADAGAAASKGATAKPADAGQAGSQAPAKADGGRNPQAAGRAKPLPPAPYRITIKLPSADPSAPAELVTEALRQAGVPFEVEMIERVTSSSTAATPLPAPAPAPPPAPRAR